ncbi:MAG: type IV conjugative transfer system protein TraL [Mariprofundaceae bacterium]
MGGMDSQERLGLRMPRHLDDPEKFLWWDFDQALIVVAIIGFSIVVNMVIAGAILGVIAGMAIGRLKSGRGRGYLVHTAYWYLPMDLGLKRTPPSHVTRFIG